MPCDGKYNKTCTPYEWCGRDATDENEKEWYCSRVPGHSGPHIACNSSEHGIYEWYGDGTIAENYIGSLRFRSTKDGKQCVTALYKSGTVYRGECDCGDDYGQCNHVTIFQLMHRKDTEIVGAMETAPEVVVVTEVIRSFNFD